MKLLFIQGGSRVRVTTNSKFYVDGNFNNDIWKRYNAYSDELHVVLRKCDQIFDEEKINNKYNNIDTNLMNLKLVDDIYSPRINFLNLKKRRKIKETIKEEVKKADKVIIRSIGNFYTNTALKYCIKYKKEYLIEVTGFAFEGLWYHSILGKIVAIPRETKLRKSIKNAPYAVYVTNQALQNRYPCNGKSLGCSDVELQLENNKILNERLKKIEKYSDDTIYKLGTAAFLNVRWKGIQDVIRALYELKREGISNFRYELIGSGNTEYLEGLIKKYNLQGQVHILGVKEHEKVFEWLNEIDIYIQPSYQEGLCRSIVEAMSQACPCIVSNAGGNKELIESDFVFRKGKIDEIKNILKTEINKNNLTEQAENNFEYSKLFNKETLDNKRNKFYKNFMNSKVGKND